MGNAWIPAHRDRLPKERADRLKAAYAAERPKSQVRIVAAVS